MLPVIDFANCSREQIDEIIVILEKQQELEAISIKDEERRIDEKSRENDIEMMKATNEAHSIEQKRIESGIELLKQLAKNPEAETRFWEIMKKLSLEATV